MWFDLVPRPLPSLKSQVSSLKGFTLLELSVVLFIIGLLVAVAFPRLGDLGGARLDSSARRLAALARYLNGEAAFSSQLYRLNYDLDQRTYWVTVLTAHNGTAEFMADPSPLSRPVQLPPSITFADVQAPSIGRVSTGRVYTHFYPHGYADPTVIHLRDQHSRIVTVTIPPLTGEARVYEGYVDALRNR
ncbi:MAG: prepilin-type N-terminal cleavage/methylation domain-containing protein [Deltaproteobacteria bacterium]|nr:prepilin-type N-terminal cleavage/methylation domain-containing protein [Deltaproteobacteria bacterium]